MNASLLDRIEEILCLGRRGQAVTSAFGLPGKENWEMTDGDVRLNVATTVEECRYVYNKADSPRLQRRAMDKALALATTTEKCQYLYEGVSYGLGFEAMKKALTLATTVRECRHLYYNITFTDLDRDDYEIRDLGEDIVKKALMLIKTVEEGELVFRMAEGTSHASACVLKIAEILEKG